MKKTIAAAAAAAASIFLTACQAVQVNERMFVQMMGIEISGSECLLTVQVYDTSSESSSPEYIVYSGTGRSFNEAANAISREQGRELFFGHCSVIFADDDILRDADKLKTLAGERISVGCPVIYSNFPGNAVSAEDSEGKTVGAEKVSGILERYAGEGLTSDSTLKSVTAAAENGGVSAVTLYGEEPQGTAVVNIAGETSLLDMTETAAYNLLRGRSGVNLSIYNGSMRLDKAEKSVYYRKTEENGGEYQIQLSVEAVLTELGSENELSLYRSAAEDIISRSADAICRRGLEEGFLGTIVENEYHSSGDNIDFSVNTDVKIKEQG
ncbi:MAG: hypothetical protein NC120_03555 [Ruminococcus sp.]|nr:hypothetical protein [Ruminococcus sp.]